MEGARTDLGVEGLCEVYLPEPAQGRQLERGDDADERVAAAGACELAGLRGPAGRAGLLNQGATCYLNSLLQALFLTPGFREPLLAWRHDEARHGEEAYCIPRQLQLLFARLAASERGAVGTEALTTSFRWNPAESFRQHDIQELMRVLFGALEAAVPDASAFLGRLYRGTLVDYIHCSGCGFRREHDEAFFDLSLVVQGHASVEEALEQYVRPEVLDGDNRWRCGGCDQKVRAEKGLRIRELPDVLTVQLKRFVYDMYGGGRVKVNDEVRFGERLEVACDGEAAPRAYRLFAVLMHSGTAAGGHYYAYARTAGRWLEYNDAAVCELPGDDPLEAAYGGDARGGPGRGTSAYMLMYRREGGAGGADEEAEAARWDAEVDAGAVPGPLLEAVRAEDEVWRERRAEQERERRTLDVTVAWRGRELAFRHDMGVTLNEVKAAALALAGSPPPDADANTRLRAWDAGTGFAAATFTGRGGETLEALRFGRHTALVLEERAPGEEFPEWDPAAVPLRFRRVRPGTIADCVQERAEDTGVRLAAREEAARDRDRFVARVPPALTIDALRRELETSVGVGVPAEHQRLVLLLADEARVLADGDATVASLDLAPGECVYVEDAREDGAAGGDGDGAAAAAAAGSPLAARFDLARCQVRVEYTAPADPAAAAAAAAAGVAADPVYDRVVRLSKNCTLAQLKEAVAPALGLATSEFRLRQSAKGPQYKDEGATLARLGLGDRSVVFVERGRATGRHEVELEVFLYRPEARQPRDRFERLWRRPYDRKATVERLKAETVEALREARPDLEARHVRLRERKNGKAGRIFQDRATLARSVPLALRDGYELAVQVLPEAERMAAGDRVVFVQRWLPGRAALRRPRELIVRKSETVGGLRETLRRMTGNDDLADAPGDAIGVARAPATSRLNKAAAARLEFSHPQLVDEQPLRLLPLSVHDGDTLVYQDSRVPLNPELAASASAEQLSIKKRRAAGRKRRAAAASAAADEVRVPASRRREHALRIYTAEERPAAAPPEGDA